MTDRPPDLDIGAFSDHAPWIVEPDKMPWRRDVDLLREMVQRDVPDLIRPRRWPPGPRVVTVAGRFGAAIAGWYLGERRGPDRMASRRGISRRTRAAMEHLGATYIKLAQIIAAGEGLFPTELVEEYKKCRDQVRAESFADVRRVVEAELRGPLEATFASFDRTALAAASIAQVHRATLLDGTEVVVKVQRPQVSETVHQDLRALAWLAPFLVGRIPVTALANPPALVQVFAETISEELDFRLEAANMLDVAKSLADLDQRNYVIPRPHPELVTRRLLVMEPMHGFRFDDVSGIRSAGIDTHEIIRTWMIAFMEGALIHGIFHGDLHAGNLFVQPDGRTALFDFGITGRLDERRRHAFLRMMISATMSDIRGQVAAIRDLGALPHDVDIDEIIADLGLDGPPIDPTKLSQQEIISEVQRIVKLLLSYGARMPRELMLFVKNMVFLDGSIAALAPDLDLIAEVQSIALHFATTHGETLAAQIGMDPSTYQVDLATFKDAMGVDRSVDQFTYADLRARRELIQKRLHDPS